MRQTMTDINKQLAKILKLGKTIGVVGDDREFYNYKGMLIEASRLYKCASIQLQMIKELLKNQYGIYQDGDDLVIENRVNTKEWHEDKDFETAVALAYIAHKENEG
jgi:hypothetical protein